MTLEGKRDSRSLTRLVATSSVVTACAHTRPTHSTLNRSGSPRSTFQTYGGVMCSHPSGIITFKLRHYRHSRNPLFCAKGKRLHEKHGCKSYVSSQNQNMPHFPRRVCLILPNEMSYRFTIDLEVASRYASDFTI